MITSNREKLPSAESSFYQVQNEVHPGAGKMKTDFRLVLHVFLRYRKKAGILNPNESGTAEITSSLSEYDSLGDFLFSYDFE